MESINSEKTKNAGTLVACAIYDSKAAVYFQPFFARSRAEAIRTFSSSANKEGHIFNEYPEDFTLKVLAEWNEDTGQFIGLPVPDVLGTASEYIRREGVEGQQALI